MRLVSTLGIAFALTLGLPLLATDGAEPASKPASRPASQKASPRAEVHQAWPFDAVEAAKRQDEAAKALGVEKEITFDLTKKVAVKLVLIPAGKFVMGSPKDEAQRNDEEAQHEVAISKPFYMGICAVTQEQYEQVMGKNPSAGKGATNPVDTVSWDDALEFCKKLSQKTGKTVILPTEAQWEYACRAGTTTPFHTGETIGSDQANCNGLIAYGDGKRGEYRKKTMPTGTFKPNAWGLYDMHGNVCEWCADWYDTTYYANSPKENPQGPADGKRRVLRGGSWTHSPAFCRSACRGSYPPDGQLGSFGLRVVVLPGAD